MDDESLLLRENLLLEYSNETGSLVLNNNESHKSFNLSLSTSSPICAKEELHELAKESLSDSVPCVLFPAQ